MARRRNVDIFRFWTDVGPRDHLHPADRDDSNTATHGGYRKICRTSQVRDFRRRHLTKHKWVQLSEREAHGENLRQPLGNGRDDQCRRPG
jgi:hypothetical protein